MSQDIQGLNACLSLLKDSNYAAAIPRLVEIAHDNPHQPDVLNTLGLAYAMAKDWDNAATVYAQSLQADQHQTDTRRKLSFVFKELGNYKDVLATLEPLKEHLTDDPQCNLLYAEAHFSLGNYENAIGISEKIIDSYPSDPMALQISGVSAMHLDEFKVAIKRLSDLLEQHPDECQILEKYAYSLFFDGQTESAQQQFQSLTRLLKPSSDFERTFHTIYTDGLLATKTPPNLRRRQRFLFLCSEFLETQNLDGDVAECGVFQGLSSYTLCSLMRSDVFDGALPNYHAFDSFEGLSAPTPEDTEGLQPNNVQPVTKGAYRCSLEEVTETLKTFDNISFYRGWIPSRFTDVEQLHFRFVHLDVDLYEPTRASLEFFFPRLVSGGKIICDDYGWVGAKAAIDEFCAAHGLEPVIHDRDQALICKSS